MKKLIALVLTLVCVLGLVSCSKTNELQQGDNSGRLERPGAAYPAGAGETAAAAPDTETTGYGDLTITSGTRHFQFWNDGCLFHFKEAAIAFI